MINKQIKISKLNSWINIYKLTFLPLHSNHSFNLKDKKNLIKTRPVCGIKGQRLKKKQKMSVQRSQQEKDLEMMTLNKQSDEPLLPSTTNNKNIIMIDDESLVSIVTSRVSQRATCPSCGFNGMTIVKKIRTECGVIMMWLLLLCCLCCIPMCIKSFNKCLHSC